MATWNGVVFVNLNPRAVPLERRIMGLVAHSTRALNKHHSWSAMEADHGIWDANWKIVYENAAESYHLFAVHPKTLEKVTPTKDAYYLAGNAEWSLTGGANTYGGDYELIALPPSFVGILDKDGMMWVAVRPLGPERSQVIGGYSGITNPRDGGKRYAKKDAEWYAKLMEEDRQITARVQRGVRATRSQGSPLLPIERTLGDFHQYLARRLFNSCPARRRRRP